MKISAIVCGRKNRTTEHLARVALQQIAEDGHEIALINLMNLDIQACINCVSCVRAMRDETFEGSCPLRNDDMAWLDEQILSSDGLLFAAPMFENAAPGPYKIMCDRIGPSHDVTLLRETYDRRTASGKDPKIDVRFFHDRAAAFIGHGGSEWSHLSFPSLAVPAVSLGMTIVDYVHFDWNSDLILKDGSMARVKQCGRHLAQMAALPPEERFYIGTRGACPACHCDVIRIREDTGQATCSLCGLSGPLLVTPGRICIGTDEERIKRSNLFDSGRQIHMNDLKRNGQIMARIDKEEVRRRTEPLQQAIPVLMPSAAAGKKSTNK